jgi:hypothetical protein
MLSRGTLMLTLFINSMMHAVMIDHISVYTTSEEVFYSGPRLHPLPSAAASTFFGLQPLNPVFSCATSAPMTWKNASSTPCWFTSNLIYRKPGNRCTGRSLTHSAANNKTRNKERGKSYLFEPFRLHRPSMPVAQWIGASSLK